MTDFHIVPSTVPVRDDRPLLIVDADEVLLRFAAGLDRFLDARGMALDLSSYRLHGNISYRDSGEKALDIEVTALLDEFRADLDCLEAVEHVVEAMAELTPRLQIVVLSNVNAAQAPARLRNLKALGWDFPLLCNSGPKGPAIAALARRAGKPVFFVDDIPLHHSSAAEHANDVIRIHLIGDDRLKPLLPPAEHAHLKAEDWRHARDFILSHLGK